MLQEVDCRGERARLLLQAGQRQVTFLINDPNRFINRNAPGTGMDLTCEKQPPGTQMLIEFEEKHDPALGTAGEVRKLEFVKSIRPVADPLQMVTVAPDPFFQMAV